MKEFTLKRSLINVNNVGSILVKQEASIFMKDFTLGKSLINVNSVASVLAELTT